MKVTITLRTIITLAILLNAVGLQAQKSNPRGIYHMVSITGKNGTEAAMYDQYKICTDSITWMLNITEDKSINKHGVRTNHPYFELGDNDHKVFNYTGEQPDTDDSTKTRIYNSNKKGFILKWWSTSRGHRVFPENGWCTEQYESNSFTASGKKIFDMLYSTKNKAKKDGLQGRWKVVGAIKMSGSKIVDEWLKSGKLDLKENDYVPYHDKYAIIDDQYLLTAYSEAMLNQQYPSIYGYLQKYQLSDQQTADGNVTVKLIPNDQTRPQTYVFYRICNDKMIVKVEHSLIIDDRSDCLYYGYEIWEKTASNTPLTKQLTSARGFTNQKIVMPKGLYRYVAGGELCRIRETRDSTDFDEKTRQWIRYIERYKLCTDTINWNIAISDSDPNKPHGQNVGDNCVNYLPKEVFLRNGSPASMYTQATDAAIQEKWTLFGCSETGFSETGWIDSKNTGVWTFDNRNITPRANEVLDVLDGKIPYDANHPLYGTWEVEGQVRNPSETKIDSIMKGLYTDYVFPYIRNVRLFYAFTSQNMYTLDSSGRLWIDKLDSDGKTSLVTWEQYRAPEKGYTIEYLNWTIHWIDTNTLLICRNKQNLQLFIPVCLVLKRKVGGDSLINVLNHKSINNLPPVHI